MRVLNSEYLGLLFSDSNKELANINHRKDRVLSCPHVADSRAESVLRFCFLFPSSQLKLGLYFIAANLVTDQKC